MGPSKQPIPTSLNPGGGGAVTAVRLGFPEIGGGSSLQPRFSAPEPRSAHSDTGEDKRASPWQCGAEPRRTRPRHVLAQEAHHDQQGPGAPAHHAGESPSRTHNHGEGQTPTDPTHEEHRVGIPKETQPEGSRHREKLCMWVGTSAGQAHGTPQSDPTPPRSAGLSRPG